MPVPATINDLSTTAASNSPAGSEPALPQMDDFIRALSAFIAQLRDGKLNASSVSTFMQSVLDDADAATARATLGAVGLTDDQTIAGVKTFSSSPVVPAATTSGQAANKGQLDSALSASSPAGMVACFAMPTAPSGWLKCNGDAVYRTSYSALFAAIGTTFGSGNGSTTFNLPDLRGEFIRGVDDGHLADPGRVFGSWQADDFRSHNHSISQGSNFGSGTYVQPNSYGPTGSTNTGSTGGTETRPRNVALLFCIKT